MLLDVDPRPRHHKLVYGALVLMAAVAQQKWAVALANALKKRRPSPAPSSEAVGQPTAAPVRLMGRLGLFYVTAIMTCLSAVLSAFVAWLFSFVIDVPNYNVHILLASIIPFFVTPVFSYLSALSMRDLQRARKKAVDLARLDTLTGLGNRRAFFDTARRAQQSGIAQSNRAVLYIDIDHFKTINDRYGHDAGDAVLKHFAEQLRACTRAEDVVARIGGEEFVVHVVNIEPAGLAAIAQGLLARVRATTVVFEGQHIRCTVSIGGAIGDADLPIDQLLALADEQLYAVKRSTRNGYSATDERGTAAAPSPHVPIARRTAA